MRRWAGVGAVLVLAAGQAGADAAFWEQALALLDRGQAVQAARLADQVLAARPDDADALVIAGAAALANGLSPRHDDSIYRPQVDPQAPPTAQLGRDAAARVAAYWEQVPPVDPSRAYLWGDLAQLTFRAGDNTRALGYAARVLAEPASGLEARQAAATVFALNLDWTKAAAVLAPVRDPAADLYRGLGLWVRSQDGAAEALKAFLARAPAGSPGLKLTAYLLGPAMRDNEAGFLQAEQVETGPAALAVRQKYAERYPNRFLPRLDLARSLCQLGSFGKAWDLYGQLEKAGVANGPEEKQALLFQSAWAAQGAGLTERAAPLWETLAEAKDFYLRSAACWFLGRAAQARSDLAEARDWWSRVADEPARSKYAAWAAAELKPGT